ncbi:hypothetical protein H0H93_015249 [Arthromyces matolae]|nr:hypothetical protein H0H93_015249 [Arthromyces matolae]
MTDQYLMHSNPFELISNDSNDGGVLLCIDNMDWDAQDDESEVRLTESLVTGVDFWSPSSTGTFSDIFKGSYDGRDVAVKSLRVSNRRSPTAHKRVRFATEFNTWKDLSHPNVLPFLGITQIPSSPSPAMVFPWMHNGSLDGYLATGPPVDALKLVRKVRFSSYKNLK